MRLGDIEWLTAIDDAKRGDLKMMIKLLRSNHPIYPDTERQIRDAIASLLAGDFKRPRGRPRKTFSVRAANTIAAKLDDFCMVLDIKDMHKKLKKDGVSRPLRAACDQYAAQTERFRANGASILRYYKKAKAKLRASGDFK